MASDPLFMAAMGQRRIVARDFLRLVARTRAPTPAPVAVCFWSDLQTAVVPVIDPETGVSTDRTWNGAGSLVQISAIPSVSSLTVQTVSIALPQYLPQVEQAVREYDIKQARVEIYTGLFDPDTRLLVSPAECVFVGYVDECDIQTPAENDEGSLTLTATSDTQEMTRSNPAKRSDESQRLRNGSDNFYQDTAAIKNRKIFWGVKATNTAKPRVQDIPWVR